MDNGQHVFLRCCTAYRGLLERLGSTDRVTIQPRLDIPVLKPGAEPFHLRRGGLPSPFHLAGALARYPHLSLIERLGAARAALALMRLDPNEESLDSVTFGDWLARHGQGPRTLEALWDLIALPTLNLPAAQASLQLAAFVFRTGLLSGTDAGDIGFHTATLQEIIGDPAAGRSKAGVEVKLGWPAERLCRDERGFVLASAPAEESLQAEAAIVALPHDVPGPARGAARRRPEGAAAGELADREPACPL